MRIDQATWTRISPLLDLALDRPTSELPAWLETLSREQPDAAPLIRQLLDRQAAIETDDFLTSLPQIRGPLPADEDRSSTTVHAPGRRVGVYVLESQLGRGGMGTVWRARRDDGLLNRTVALKLPIAGPFQQDFIERFARERDILATLAHPNIARLYDAGITEDGQPYLAMEYVEGLPLATYCSEQRAGIAQRLALFTQILEAVKYAHSRLILHRDIKPSNILVTAAGKACLLDFGIAKLINVGNQGTLELTQFAGRPLTPIYASPEQIAGAALTVASDVYSLGVLLYELLSGERPYRLSRNSVAALEEAILRADAVRPSQAIRDPKITGAIGGLSVAKLRRALSGDLDNIILKALKKDPAQRYPTVDAFADDLQRHLSGLPVRARPDSALYRLGKFVARQRYAVGGTVVVALALVAATILSVRQARIAREQAAIAGREATRAQAVQDFLLDIFRTNTHLQRDALKARQTTAREMLDIGAARVGERLKDTPEVAAEVLMTLGDMYTQMGLDSEASRLRLQRIAALKRAQGPASEDLADALLDYVVDISATAERSRIPAVLQEVATVLDTIGDRDSEMRAGLWMELGNYVEFTAPEKMLALEEDAVRLLATHHADSWTYQLALDKAAQAQFELGNYAESESLYRRSLQDVHRRESGTSAWEITPLAGIAAVQVALGKIADAELNYRASLAATLAVNGESHVQTQLAQSRLGAFLHATSRGREGLQLLATAVDGVRRNTEAEGSTTSAAITASYGRALLADGRIDAAEEYVLQDVDFTRRMFPESTLLAAALLELGRWDTWAGRFGDAHQALDQAVDLRRSIGGDAADASLRNPYIAAQAELALAERDPARAIDWIGQLRAPRANAQSPLSLADLVANTLLAEAYRMEGRLPAARQAGRAAVESIQNSTVRDYFHELEARATLALGEALRNGGDAHAALPLLERTLKLRLADEASRSPWLAQARVSLARCLLDLGEPARARSLYEAVARSQAGQSNIGPQFREPVEDLARRLNAGRVPRLAASGGAASPPEQHHEQSRADQDRE